MGKKSVHDLLWEKLTRGVTDKLEVDGAKVDKWSPNNLRRLVISPEGVLFQVFVTKGTFFKSPIGVVEFPVTESTQSDLDSRTTLTSVLYRKRVFSSIEEVIIIPNSTNVPYSLSAREVQTLQRKINSFKRLSDVVIVKNAVSLKEFTKNNLKAMEDPYKQLADSKDANLGECAIISLNKDWYNHTALRPQFYTLDEDGKELSGYFKSVKENLSNKSNRSIDAKQEGNSEEKVPKLSNNEEKSFSKQSKTIVTYRLLQANFLKNREKSNNRLFWFSLYSAVEIKQIKKGLGFKDGQDENFNEALKRLGLYEDEGVSDDKKLKEVVGKQIVLSTMHLIERIKKDYPIFGSKLDKEIKRGISKSLTLDELRRLATLDYRRPFESSVVFSNIGLSAKERELLINGLKGKAKECMDVGVGILFDLGYKKEDVDFILENGEIRDITSNSDSGLDVVLLHDLYVYCNKVKHRMYNSLFGTKGYVTDQPVGERIRLLVKEIGDSDEDEWEKCKSIMNRLQNEQYKNSFSNYKEMIIRQLSRLNSEDFNTDLVSEKVIRVVIEILENIVRTSAGRLAVVFTTGKLNRELDLGAKGVSNSRNDVVRKIIDFNKAPNKNFSSYLGMIEDLVLK